MSTTKPDKSNDIDITYETREHSTYERTVSADLKLFGNSNWPAIGYYAFLASAVTYAAIRSPVSRELSI